MPWLMFMISGIPIHSVKWWRWKGALLTEMMLGLATFLTLDHVPFQYRKVVPSKTEDSHVKVQGSESDCLLLFLVFTAHLWYDLHKYLSVLEFKILLLVNEYNDTTYHKVLVNNLMSLMASLECWLEWNYP